MTRSNDFCDFRRLPKPANNFDVALLLKHDIVGNDGKTHSHFEKFTESKAEDQKRIELLRQSSNTKAHQLANRT